MRFKPSCPVDSAEDAPNQATQQGRLTSKDIARLAGVSQTTVSRVLRDEKTVRPSTREHVLAVIREHNYHPSAAARSMKTRRTNTVAVVVARFSNPLYPYMLQLISNHLRQHGLLMTVWESEPQAEQPLLRAIGEGAIDGVLVTTATEQESPLFERIALHTPVVLLNRTLANPEFDQISSNNYAGGASVAEYFLTHQRDHPAILTGFDTASTIREREHGYTSALQASGRPLASNARLAVDDFSYESGYQAAQALLSISPQIDALFCTNDIIAIGACDGLIAMGRRIPQDVWLVGYDDIPMASWKRISLSTMRQPLHSMVRLAVARLLARIRGCTENPEKISLHSELIVRATSG